VRSFAGPGIKRIAKTEIPESVRRGGKNKRNARSKSARGPVAGRAAVGFRGKRHARARARTVFSRRVRARTPRNRTRYGKRGNGPRVVTWWYRRAPVDQRRRRRETGSRSRARRRWRRRHDHRSVTRSSASACTTDGRSAQQSSAIRRGTLVIPSRVLSVFVFTTRLVSFVSSNPRRRSQLTGITNTACLRARRRTAPGRGPGKRFLYIYTCILCIITRVRMLKITVYGRRGRSQPQRW